MMNSAKQITRSTTFFRLPILLTCLVFLITGCGDGPSVKVQEPNAVNGSIDFSQAPQDADGFAEVGVIFLGQSILRLDPHDNYTGEFTIEAMVKKHVDIGNKGSIFSRTYDDAGISLYFDAGQPKFAIKKAPFLFTQYTVDSNGFTLVNDVWTHIAASLTTEDHSTGPNAHASCVGGGTGWATSIAVDSSDNVHISYVDSAKVLNYAKGSLDSWSLTKVDTTTIVGQESTSIDTDSNSKAHISYYDSIKSLTEDGVVGALKYANNTSGDWVKTSSILTGGETSALGSYSALAIDSSNKTHIGFFHDTPANVGYTTNSSGPWESTGIGGFGGKESGKYISMTTTPTGSDIYTVFYDATAANKNLNYIQGHLYPSRVFSAETTIDATGDVGQFTSITRSSSGALHVSYYDVTNTALKYITCAASCSTPANWTAATIDNAADVGKYTSIVTGSDNRIHISYYDVTNGNLKYASCPGTCTNPVNWTITTIDNGGTHDVGQYSSIDVDSANNVHISYFDATDKSLHYATNQHFAWNLDTVDTGDARSEAAHLDMFVNGNFMNCAATGGNFSDPLDKEIKLSGIVKDINESIGLHLGAWKGFPLGSGTRLNASIDDVRFWAVARTESEIQQCMDQELTVSQGNTCSINNTILKGYWKFSTGTGEQVQDHSGSGNSGNKLYCDGDGTVDCDTANAEFLPWDGGWTTDSPF